MSSLLFLHVIRCKRAISANYLLNDVAHFGKSFCSKERSDWNDFCEFNLILNENPRCPKHSTHRFCEWALITCFPKYNSDGTWFSFKIGEQNPNRTNTYMMFLRKKILILDRSKCFPFHVKRFEYFFVGLIWQHSMDPKTVFSLNYQAFLPSWRSFSQREKLSHLAWNG